MFSLPEKETQVYFWLTSNVVILVILGIAAVLVALIIWRKYRTNNVRRIFINNGRICGSVACGSIAKIFHHEKPEWYEVLEEELKRISVGKLVFNPSEKMRVGVRERIEVRISKNPDADIVSALKGRGVAQIEDINVSELMKIRLSGSDFNIIPLNEEEQFIGSQGVTEWAWDVIPQKSGNKVLHLHVTLRIRLPFGEERKDHPVLDKSVLVKVNPIYITKLFVITNWKWIATGIILPLIAFVWKTYIK